MRRPLRIAQTTGFLPCNFWWYHPGWCFLLLNAWEKDFGGSLHSKDVCWFLKRVQRSQAITRLEGHWMVPIFHDVWTFFVLEENSYSMSAKFKIPDQSKIIPVILLLYIFAGPRLSRALVGIWMNEMERDVQCITEGPLISYQCLKILMGGSMPNCWWEEKTLRMYWTEVKLHGNWNIDDEKRKWNQKRMGGPKGKHRNRDYKVKRIILTHQTDERAEIKSFMHQKMNKPKIILKYE